MTQKQAVAAELAPSGVLRVAMNYGNPVLAQRGANEQSPKGVSADLARSVAQELGLSVQFHGYDAAQAVVEAVYRDEWDLAFLAIDPKRAEKIRFSEAYVHIEGTYLVRDESAFQNVDQLDQQGVCIAVGKGAAYDLFLSRHLKHADLVRATTSAAAIDLFVEEELDAAAGVRQPLERYARSRSGLRVLPDSFTVIRQAMAVPSERTLAHAWVEAFIARQKKEGMVAQFLADSGQANVTVPE
ncbi:MULTISPECIES: transporter substrate-binding domain-containing protein [Alcaligenes]|uniref:Transporter substrate-binding domain-containing protein n=1 Tax=Alcaligenes phenolicus TaxID=232846 RepID=A0AAW5VI39_9BURK|nr:MULTISPECIES: transporter substrate-binding domain-containing protein [Alcaligenes]MCR4144836.1 transporter substrate-binding domain-containing protein [Alcaligenes faecalis]MCX5563804.1 transporter substrate-binding domain-containing protein [Alcaligenes phenolicus]